MLLDVVFHVNRYVKCLFFKKIIQLFVVTGDAYNSANLCAPPGGESMTMTKQPINESEVTSLKRGLNQSVEGACTNMPVEHDESLLDSSGCMNNMMTENIKQNILDTKKETLELFGLQHEPEEIYNIRQS